MITKVSGTARYLVMPLKLEPLGGNPYLILETVTYDSNGSLAKTRLID